MIHETAAHGFEVAAPIYDRARPDYPQEAIAALVEHLHIASGTRLVDLGAGTGKLTRSFIGTGADIVAVEPLENMRRAFAQELPQLPIVEGSAELLPFADASMDAIVVGSAFHWFDGPAALRELHRVLRPNGSLGLIWSPRDETVDWMAQLLRLVDSFKQGDPPRYLAFRWRQAFESTAGQALFTPLQAARFPFTQTAPRAIAIDRVSSTSFVAALPAAKRTEVLHQVRMLLDSHPDTQGRPMLELPYRADIYWCMRQPS